MQLLGASAALAAGAALWSLSDAAPAACEGRHRPATKVTAPKSAESDVKFNKDDFAIFSGRANPAVRTMHRPISQPTTSLCNRRVVSSVTHVPVRSL